MSCRLSAAITVLALSVGVAQATPDFGVTKQAFRNPIPMNVYSSQWSPAPLFNLLMQSSSDQGGYDVIVTTNTYAPVNAQGTPSQSGWHDHPVAIGFVQIVQGAVWTQEQPNFNCLTYHPTGSVLIERRGEIHNVYNLDKQTPAILVVTFLMERSEPATRTDQPDQVTHDPNVASPPPALCAESPAPPAVTAVSKR
jgi:hypothetical protein